jgi:hypothetical protein
MIVKCLLVECVSWRGTEEINDKQEFIRGSITQVLDDGSKQRLKRILLRFRTGDVQQNWFALNLRWQEIKERD